jgi:hypothetical protein
MTTTSDPMFIAAELAYRRETFGVGTSPKPVRPARRRRLLHLPHRATAHSATARHA